MDDTPEYEITLLEKYQDRSKSVACGKIEFKKLSIRELRLLSVALK